MSQTPVSIYFAPFQGITTKPFRELYARHFQGVDKLYTPYFSNFAVGCKLPPRKQRDLKDQYENGIEVVPQVLSKSADEIVSFARNCEEFGFKELNWNLGCPYPQVTRKLRGAGMLSFPEMVDEILEKVIKEIKISFSVKCRLGNFSAKEMDALIPVFNRYPIIELTIHARIGKQLYSGKPDLDSFEGAVAQIQKPVAYNGDIFSSADFESIKLRFPEINLIMIGRGILSDPFLPSRIKGFELLPDPSKTISTFIHDLYMAYRNERDDNPSVLNAMKEYWAYLAESFDEPVKVFRKVRKAKTFDDYEEVVAGVFDLYKWIGSDKHQG